MKIRPAFVGICGTDLTEYMAGPILCPKTTHPLTKEKLPVTLGNELRGVVEEIGPEVTGIEVGDSVAVFPLLCDSTCSACIRGYTNCCQSFGAIGFSGGAGGLSEFLVTSPENVYKLPPGVDLQQGALVEPLTVAWHAVSFTPIHADDSVLVIGAGPIGISVVQVLKAKGIRNIVLSEVSKFRQDLAEQFGPVQGLDPSYSNRVENCKKFCGGDGPAVVFDAADVQAGLGLALAASRVGATIVNIAEWKTPAAVDMMLLTLEEKKYTGAMVYLKRDFEQVLAAMAKGDLNPKTMITSVIQLNEVEEGFKGLIKKKVKDMKILVKI